MDRGALARAEAGKKPWHVASAGRLEGEVDDGSRIPFDGLGD